jgi:hypothetical protein
VDFGSTEQAIEDAWDAWDAFEELTERLPTQLRDLPTDEADVWCRAVVAEHVCFGAAEHRYGIYDALLRAVRAAREGDSSSP